MQKVVFAVVACLTLLSSRTALAHEDSINQTLKDQLATVLREHPELFLDVLEKNAMDALTIMERAALKKEALTRQERRVVDLKRPLMPIIEPGRPARGNPAAPITIVEYGDFQCAYCAVAARTLNEVLEKYKDRVRFIYKHNPLAETSMPGAVSFEAIAKQDVVKAWEFHDLLFDEQENLKRGKNTLQQLQQQVGIDVSRLESDLDAARLQVVQDKKEAQQFGFTGTPVFLVNGIPLYGAVSEKEFSEAIELVWKHNDDLLPSQRN